MPVLLGFLLPAAILLRLAVRDIAVVNLDRYADSMLNSFAAAGLSALAATVLALLLAYAVRLHPVSAVRAGARLSALGYAVPGAVLAVAILVPLARLDNALDAFLQAHFGWNSGLLFTGSVTALVYAYVVRASPRAWTRPPAASAAGRCGWQRACTRRCWRAAC
jgi:iron(III) transport system permease protein